MSATEQAHMEFLTLFSLDAQLYGIPLGQIERVVRAAATTRLPKAPAIVFGVIDVAGEVIPVLNVRKKFRLPEREIGVDDHFLIARTQRHKVALQIDRAEGVAKVPSIDVIGIGRMVELMKGVVKLADGLVVIHDLDTFLSLDEERALDEALSEETQH